MGSEVFQLALLLTLKDAASSGLDRFDAKLLAAGKVSSRELTDAYVDRIRLLNSRGPSLNAVRVLNPDAEEEAKVSDRLLSFRLD